MPAAPLPPNEEDRLAALRSYGVIDDACCERFNSLTRIAARITGSPIALVSLIEGDRQWFKSRQGLDITETPRSASFCAHTILQPAGALVVPDARQDPRFADNPMVIAAPHLAAYAGVALVNADGYPLGALCVLDRQPHAYGADEIDMLRELAQAVVTSLELHRSTAALQTMARTDMLTETATRYAFLDELRLALDRQRSDGGPLAVICLDLNGFRLINEQAGFAIGDAVLVMASLALRSVLRPTDVSGRLGGDKFGVLLPATDAAGLSEIAERLRVTMVDCMAACDWPITASLGGVAFLAPPEDENVAMTLVDNTERESRAGGVNRSLCRVFDGSPAAVG